MKYISVAIPSYNSEEYVERAINSVLVAGDDVEILVVNDGSSDRTSEIAHQYEKKYPNIVKAIDKPNGGHGDAVMAGLMYATGLYFKVLDSDDWFDKDSLLYIIKKIKEFNQEEYPDMLLSNYVYEKVGVTKKKVIKYNNVFDKEQICDWSCAGKFKLGQYIIMHSVMYRTELLHNSGISLPRHTFYVDNIYVYYPLPLVKTLYYIDVNLYRYFIGRDDQSVNEQVMMSRVDQQLKVNKLMIDMYKMPNIENKHLRSYMTSYLAIMMAISSILLIKIKTKEALEKKKELWKYLKKSNPSTYFKIRYGILGQSMNLPGKPGRRISILGYKVAKHFIGFN